MGKGGPEEWVAEIKEGVVGGGHCLFTMTSSPQLVKSPSLSFLPNDGMTLPCPLPSFPMAQAPTSSSSHGPSLQPPPWSPSLQSPPPVHPCRAPELASPSSAQGSSMAPQYPLDPAYMLDLASKALHDLARPVPPPQITLAAPAILNCVLLPIPGLLFPPLGLCLGQPSCQPFQSRLTHPIFRETFLK